MARTEKVSVALDKDALVRAKRVAAADGLSLSGLLMQLLTAHFEKQQRLERMGEYLTEFAPKVHVSEAAMQAIRDEMTAPLKPVRRTKRKRAA